MKSHSRSGITSRPYPQTQVRPLALAIALLFTPPALLAQPTGGQVVSGQASIGTPAKGLLTINQTSQKAILNWQNFSIGVGEATHFQQPKGGVALNRVTGGSPSEILGTLTSTGQVFLVNPSGILFGKGSVLNVGGLTASTLDIADGDFLDGNYRFFNDGTAKSITNQGELSAYEGSYIALLAPEVRNEGVITARLGTVAIGAGDRVSLDFDGDGLIGLNVEESALNGRIDNKQAIHADGGQVILSARAAGSLAETVINNEGVIRANSASERNGRIVLEGARFISQSGSISATGSSGANGGSVRIAADNVVLSGDVDVSGQQGGSIEVDANGNLIQTEGSQLTATGSAAAGGQINLHASTADASGQVFLSGDLSVQGLMGGQVHVLGDRVTLASANINATGASLGGEILIGGGYQGALTGVAHSRQTGVNATTVLDASATDSGAGGRVVVWSDGNTAFAGQALAKGGVRGGDGGLVEVSGKEAVYFDGMVNAGPASGTGKNGVFLLDPKNITISASAQSSAGYFELSDPSPAAGDQHGSTTLVFGTDQLLVLSPYDDNAATDAGAMYVYNTATGAMLSMLTGDTANDRIGSGGITPLYNNSGYDYLVKSPYWHESAGALTWIDGAGIGFDGVLSSGNSLVGSSANDGVGSSGLTSLYNGNYLVLSPNWGGGKGAVTFFNPASGVVGEVSELNSLVGSSSTDNVGSGGIQEIWEIYSGGYLKNYLVLSPNWGGGKGAISFGSRTSGVIGAVGESNSYVGDTAGDHVGSGGITSLSNGSGYDYLIKSPSWHSSAGAVTWFDGAGSGFGGVVGAGNSLVGSSANDGVGSGGFDQLSSGNYLVLSPNWGGGKGAVTFMDPTTGVVGVVSDTNSLVGSVSTDNVGSGDYYDTYDIYDSETGEYNYLVFSSNWGGGKGAVTFGSGATGVSGIVSSSNSLVGDTAGDRVGSGAPQLIYGNSTYAYQIKSPLWHSSAGAMTWMQGSGVGFGGVLGAANSLVGSSANDSIGSGGYYQLDSGNYLVRSPNWGGGKGAVTFMNPNTGVVGVVSDLNSLVGSTSSDNVGSGGIYDIYDGESGVYNYLVLSPNWNGTMGAVTFGDGDAGISGIVSSSNSYVGDTTGDRVGYSGVQSLYNDGVYAYLIKSPFWHASAGALTWVDGSGSGFGGVVDSSNSLVGSSANDAIGSSGITTLSSGSFVVRSPNWGGGKGAVTFLNPAGTWVVGVVSDQNSLVGETSTDNIGSGGIVNIYDSETGSYNYLVVSPNWSGELGLEGAVTFGNGATGISGFVSTNNSFIGDQAGDKVGSGGVQALYNSDTGYSDHYLIKSPLWHASAGAMTVMDGGGSAFSNVDFNGTISGSNSLVGSSANDNVGSGGYYSLDSGNYLLLSPNWGGGKGAVTFLDPSVGVTGEVSDQNSLVGSVSTDNVGSGDYYDIYDIYDSDTGEYNYLVFSTNWDGGKGAVTFGSGATGVSGLVSASNSFVGDTAGDRVGSSSPQQIYNNGTYAYLIKSPLWHSSAGAITWLKGDGSAFSAVNFNGTVSGENSLVGSSANDNVGSGIDQLYSGNYLLLSPNWGGGKGAVTFLDPSVGVTGVVSDQNSLVGSVSTDNVGSGDYYDILDIYDGEAGEYNYLVFSTNWDGGKGAVTFGSGATGVSGIVSASNSFVGDTAGDRVGSAYTQSIYKNGTYAYLIRSPLWHGSAGAITWMKGDGNAFSAVNFNGTVSASNSLVGSSANDGVGSGGYYQLDSDNFLIRSPDWGGGKGAITFMDPTVGVVGVVSNLNSLVGSATTDNVGSGGIEEIYDYQNDVYQYLVFSPDWGGAKGAVTLGSGETGVSGMVSESNSFVGNAAGDQVGSDGFDYLYDYYSGYYNYLLFSPNWGGSKGAVTWFDGTGAGFGGVVSASNSLVGSQVGDQVGSGGTEVIFGDYSSGFSYLVFSPEWNGGRGAVTLGSVATGVAGEISSSNSYIGDQAGDRVGDYEDGESNALTWIYNGNGYNYLLYTPEWHGNAGAITWFDGTGAGFGGVIGADNSLVGANAGDDIGGNGIYTYSSANSEGSPENYLVMSRDWDGGKGAVTWGDGLLGVTGVVGSDNSLVGSQAGDMVGSDGLLSLGDRNYLVRSYAWNGGKGALTFFNMADGLVTGTVSSANSIVGEQAGDLNSMSATNLGSERYLIKLPTWADSSGRLLVLSANGFSSSGWGYADNPADSVTINPGDIEAIANTGTEVILAANNDIVLAENSDILIDNPEGEGGHLIFQAGRSILLNSNITSDGDLDFYANDTLLNGVQEAHRDAGAAEITMAAGTAIETTGGVRMHMLNGGEAGGITLATVRSTEIDFLGDVLLTNSGWLGGSGQIDGDLNVNNATFAPGQSPGTVSITGDLVLGEGSLLQIEYGGTEVGQFDSIEVGGTAVLGGELELLSYAGFVPPSKLSVSFLTGNVSGRFGTVRGALAGLVPEPGGEVLAEELQSTLQELLETPSSFEQQDAVDTDQLIESMLVQAEDGGVVASSEQIQAAATQIAARREAKVQAFAKAISELRSNPASADLAECNGSKGEASGACLATRKARDLDKMIADAPSDTRKRVALLIGNDAYTGEIPALSTPISDVNAIAAKLKEKHGFEVTVLRNAGKADIVREMNRLATDTVVSDSVMVMYAGHGYQEEGSKGMGYWIPVDAKANSASGWVSNQDISKLLFAIPARQVMLVSDSCFSGSLTREQRVKAVKGLKREEVLKQRSVLVLSSGGEEPVSDLGHDGHSIFAWNVLKVLDTAENGLTGFELYRQVHEGVIKEFPQQPQYGASIFAGHKGDGDYFLDRLN